MFKFWMHACSLSPDLHSALMQGLVSPELQTVPIVYRKQKRKQRGKSLKVQRFQSRAFICPIGKGNIVL